MSEKQVNLLNTTYQADGGDGQRDPHQHDHHHVRGKKLTQEIGLLGQAFHQETETQVEDPERMDLLRERIVMVSFGNDSCDFQYLVTLEDQYSHGDQTYSYRRRHVVKEACADFAESLRQQNRPTEKPYANRGDEHIEEYEPGYTHTYFGQVVDEFDHTGGLQKKDVERRLPEDHNGMAGPCRR